MRDRYVNWRKKKKNNWKFVGNTTVEILLPRLPKDIRLVAIDVSEKMVEHATKKHADKKVCYKKFDIEIKNVPAEFKEAFDKAFTFFCLHWVQNQRYRLRDIFTLSFSHHEIFRQAMRNIHTILKRGGGFFGNILIKHPIYNVYEAMSEQDPWRFYTSDYKKYIPPYQRSSDPETFVRNLLEENGFTVVVCKSKYREHCYGDDISLKSFIASINPFIGRMPELLVYDYLDEFIVHLQQYNKNIITSFYSNYTLLHKLLMFYAVKK